MVITERRAVAALRVFLVLLFGVLVVFQVMSLPGQFAHMAETSPEDAHLRWPLTIFSVVEVLCVEVVIVCTWRLLSMVEQDRIFSDDALVWVNSIIGAMATVWLLLLAGLLHAMAPGGPSTIAATVLALLVVAVSVAGLLMVVMRALLRQATTLRTEMDAVV